MSSTITNTITTGVTLGVTYSSPLTVASSGYVENVNPGTSTVTPAAIFGTYPGTIINYGRINGISNGGINLQAGGNITNKQGGLIASKVFGISIEGQPGTVINSGAILTTYSSGPLIGGVGIGLFNGGVISNTTAGVIASFGEAIGIFGSGVVINSGTISSTVNGAVDLNGGGTVTNTPGGILQGLHGVYIKSTGVVINTGTITAQGTPIGNSLDGIGVWLEDAGTIINDGTIGSVVTGGLGVMINAGATVVDSGLIYGANGTAIAFGGNSNNLLAVEAGYTISGRVVAGASAHSTLELLGTASGVVTVNYNALGLTNFQHVLFGPRGNATVRVSNTSGTIGNGITFSGFIRNTETIDLTQIGVPVGYAVGNNQLTVTGANGTVILNLDPSDSTQFVLQPDGVSGTDVTPCFCRGTLILTDNGERAVEHLKIGDRVVTTSGTLAPVKWIGRRAYDARFIAGNRKVLPIRIRAGAIADGVPVRDLWVSPEHAVYLEGLLVAARLLINGKTVVQEGQVELLEYFHVELEEHDIILAEGAPVESYAECNNRAMFHNAAEFRMLYPDDRPATGQFCARRIEENSKELAPLRRRMLARGKRFGCRTDDPGLRLPNEYWEAAYGS